MDMLAVPRLVVDAISNFTLSANTKTCSLSQRFWGIALGRTSGAVDHADISERNKGVVELHISLTSGNPTQAIILKRD